MACRTMQLRFLKLGTVLTYAFKEIMTDNEKDGTNYHCQGIRGVTILLSLSC